MKVIVNEVFTQVGNVYGIKYDVKECDAPVYAALFEDGMRSCFLGVFKPEGPCGVPNLMFLDYDYLTYYPVDEYDTLITEAEVIKRYNVLHKKWCYDEGLYF